MAITALAAAALALAFPKYGLGWIAPVGAVGLFWTWQRLSWKRIFWYGWFGGTIFFYLATNWFGHTVGHLLGNFAPLFVLVPTMIEGVFVGAAAVCAALAFEYAPTRIAPLGAAAAFTIFEWLRSIGVMGAPFAQLGYSQADTPLAVFAAYIGSFGVTFVVCTLGAYAAQAIILRSNRSLIPALGVVLVAWSICWLAWPARHAEPATIHVVAVQGNISQDVKWNAATLIKAERRYTRLTKRAAAFQPQLVVWPETVMTTVLPLDPLLSHRLGELARSLKTTLVTGSIDTHDGAYYNASFVYDPAGRLTAIYDKRQLVPFTEGFPGKAFLHWIPYSNLISDFGVGHVDAVYNAHGLRFAPLICWESAFADLAHAQLRKGAQVLVISTDDAWFGESSGPFQHAQIAQMRAIEGGLWVLRAASTGISGVIAPDGRYIERTGLDRPAVVLGMVGPPPGSVFALIGPTPFLLALIVLYLGVVLGPEIGRRYARHA